jgi:hypothetical protein
MACCHVPPNPCDIAEELVAPLRDLIASVKALGFEGLVAKRCDSRYEAGQRSAPRHTRVLHADFGRVLQQKSRPAVNRTRGETIRHQTPSDNACRVF